MDAGQVEVNELKSALTPGVAREILHISGPLDVVFLRSANHTWRIDTDRGAFFLKAHSKDWYAGLVAAAGGAVAHEAGAHQMLEANGFATPTVVAAEQSADNPLGWPYLLTERLAGASLLNVVDVGDQSSSAAPSPSRSPTSSAAQIPPC